MKKIRLLLSTDAPIHNKKIEVDEVQNITSELLSEWLNLAVVYKPSSISIELDYGCPNTYNGGVPYWKIKDSATSYLRTLLNMEIEKLEVQHTERMKILFDLSKNQLRDMKVRNYLGY